MMAPSIASTPAKIWNASGRGGARHKPAPALDSSLLATCFGKHKEMIGNMGAYESIGKSMSPLGPDLMKMLPLLKDIVAMSPSATLPPGPSKHALINMLLTTPRLNPGPTTVSFGQVLAGIGLALCCTTSGRSSENLPSSGLSP